MSMQPMGAFNRPYNIDDKKKISTYYCGASTNVKLGVQHCVDIVPDIFEVLVFLNTLDKVIVATLSYVSFVRNQYPTALDVLFQAKWGLNPSISKKV